MTRAMWEIEQGDLIWFLLAGITRARWEIEHNQFWQLFQLCGKQWGCKQRCKQQGGRGGEEEGQEEAGGAGFVQILPRNPRHISVISSFNFQGAPPGYIQGLINKVISNIQIVCNNLILKYVEEDLVLSLNVRTASLSSCDEAWNPAFSELSLPHLVLRKLLQVWTSIILSIWYHLSLKVHS